MALIFIRRGVFLSLKGSKPLIKHVKTHFRFDLGPAKSAKPTWSQLNRFLQVPGKKLMKFIVNSSGLQTRRFIYVVNQLDERNSTIQLILAFEKVGKVDLASFGWVSPAKNLFSSLGL